MKHYLIVVIYSLACRVFFDFTLTTNSFFSLTFDFPFPFFAFVLSLFLICFIVENWTFGVWSGIKSWLKFVFTLVEKKNCCRVQFEAEYFHVVHLVNFTFFGGTKNIVCALAKEKHGCRFRRESETNGHFFD